MSRSNKSTFIHSNSNMKNLGISTLIIACLCLLGACSKPYYMSDNFRKKAKKHESVAVLPVKMVFTGKFPDDVDPKAIAQLEEAESKAFQRSLFDQILTNTASKRKRNSPKVKFLSISKTNDLLAQNNISIRDSWKADPEKLAAVLGVDAVVSTSVEKKRYLSDMASFGIDIGKKLLTLLDLRSILYMPTDIEKTNDIYATCSVVNRTDGNVLWTMENKKDTDWQRPSAEVVRDITGGLAKYFPYKPK